MSLNSKSTKSSPLEYVTSALDEKIPFGRVHYWIILLLALGGLFNGMEQFNAGYVAPTLQNLWGLSNTAVGSMTTFTFAGMGIGSLVSGFVADRYGRKVTYMYNIGLYSAGALIGAFAPDIGILLIGRFIVGLGLGGELNVGLTMLSELVPTAKRGISTAFSNISTGGIGLFASAALAALMLGPLSDALGGEDTAWRWLLGILVLPALLVFVYRFFLPETPRFLISRGRVHDTNRVLSQLATNRLIAPRGMTVTEYVPESLAAGITPDKVRLGDILRGPMRRSTIAIWVVTLMAFGAQTNFNAFLPTLLVDAGVPIDKSLTYTMIIQAGGLVGAILAAVGGYYWKRRAVLTFSGIFCAAGSLVLFLLGGDPKLVLIIGTLLQNGMILGNTSTWIYAPELFSTRVRGFGTGSIMTALAIAGSLMPVLTGWLSDNFGFGALFGIMALMYCVMAVAVRFGPETKDKSLEELTLRAEGITVD